MAPPLSAMRDLTTLFLAVTTAALLALSSSTAQAGSMSFGEHATPAYSTSEVRGSYCAATSSSAHGVGLSTLRRLTHSHMGGADASVRAMSRYVGAASSCSL